jgi:hypothetical protein
MADNELDLMQWQIGSQSQFDTAVTPTAKLMGVESGEIQPLVETSAVPEQRASLAPAFTATIDKVSGEASIAGAANYQQIGYLFDSLLGEASPSGAGPYTRAYAAPLGSKPTPRILTLVRGSSLDARCLKGGIVNELTLTAETNQRVMYDGKMIGHSVESDALAALSDLAVDYLHSNQVALTLVTWAGTMGATALSPLAYNYELGLNFNKMLQMGLGSVTPRDHKIRKGEADSNQLKLSMELHSDSAGWFNSIISATATPFRAQIQATFTLGAASLVLQYAGYAAEAPKYVEDTDGIATLEFTFSPLYHSTFGNWFKASLVNAVATLP